VGGKPPTPSGTGNDVINPDAKMIPKIFHQSSKNFTWEERRLSRIAQTLMPEWEYRFWTDDDNLALVQRIIPHHVHEYLKLPAIVRTDISRYLYMYVYGGIYFDTDFRFFQAISEDLLSHLCILGIEEEHDPYLGGNLKLGNAFIGSAPRLELWPELIDSIFVLFREGRDYHGPHVLSRFLANHEQYEDIVEILPRNIVYPTLTRSNLTWVRDAETIGVHLCWNSWHSRSLPRRFKNRTRRILSSL
jgi:mannosyltransferase OCH1-like enzyme